MSETIWRLFPFPTLSNGALTGGALLDTHPDCAACPTRECSNDVAARVGEVRQCRFGLTYARVDPNRLVVGVVATDIDNPTKRAQRRAKLEPDRRFRASQLSSAIAKATELGPGVVEDYARARSDMMKKLESDPELHKAMAEQLRKDFEENLNQSHDFLQLVKLVRGHAEVLLNAKYPELDSADAAERLPTEGAIFFSTELMLVKMDSLIYLNEINRALGGESRVLVHPLVLKYVRIYNWQAEQKELALRLDGQCYAACTYNSQAIGAVIQGLLDNLVKYAPAGSKGVVGFDETDDYVHLSFGSLGPRIDPDERSRIFLPGYRARAARQVETGGMGVGLATAKRISDALGLELSVEQDDDEHAAFPARYRTLFRLRLDRTD